VSAVLAPPFGDCWTRLRQASAYAFGAPWHKPSLLLVTPAQATWITFLRWPCGPYRLPDIPPDDQAAFASRVLRHNLPHASETAQALRLTAGAALVLLEATGTLDRVWARVREILARPDTPFVTMLLGLPDDGCGTFAVEVLEARELAALEPPQDGRSRISAPDGTGSGAVPLSGLRNGRA
jgi:hypothetical protein